MINARRLGNAAHMVEDDRGGQPLQKIGRLNDLVAEQLNLDVPAEIVDPFRQRLEHLDRGPAGDNEIEADAANAAAVQAPELGVGDARVDHRDAAGGPA